MTRLPTVWPMRPLSQPGMTWLGVAAMVKPKGWPRVQDASKTLPVRQMTPTYCATTVWPLVTADPDPLISVLATSADGGLPDEGILITGALPVVAVTVGNVPPPAEICLPDAASPNFLIMSTTKTSVSVALTPAWELPVLP